MGRAMQDIAQGEGDLTKRLKVTSNDEFGALAISFNRFVERIHESIREVAGTARQLHDVAQLVVNASNSSMANSDEQSNRTNSVAAAKPLVLLCGFQGEAFPLAVGDDVAIGIVTRMG